MKKRKIVRSLNCTGPVVTEEMFECLPEYADILGVPFNDLLIPIRLVYGESEWFIVARFDKDNVFGFVVLEGSKLASSWGVITIDSLVGFSGIAQGHMVIPGGLVQFCWQEELKTRNAEDGCRVDPSWKPQTVIEVERIIYYIQNGLKGSDQFTNYYF